MKKIILLSLLAFISFQLSALSFSAGVDASSLMSLVYHNTGISAEAGVKINDSFRTSIGFGYYSTGDIANDIRLINTSLSADYFPFPQTGVYIGISLADLFFPFGLDSDGKVKFSNHLRFGYAWQLPYFTLDVRLNLRDLVSATANDAYYLSQNVPQLGRFSFSCLLSFRYDFKDS